MQSRPAQQMSGIGASSPPVSCTRGRTPEAGSRSHTANGGRIAGHSGQSAARQQPVAVLATFTVAPNRPPTEDLERLLPHRPHAQARGHNPQAHGDGMLDRRPRPPVRRATLRSAKPNGSYRPVSAQPLPSPSPDDYETVLPSCPIWWGSMPMACSPPAGATRPSPPPARTATASWPQRGGHPKAPPQCPRARGRCIARRQRGRYRGRSGRLHGLDMAAAP